MRIVFFIVSFLTCTLTLHSLSYDTSIEGIRSVLIQDALKKASSTFSQDHEVPSVRALRLRAEQDLESMTKALQYFGYYNATLSYHIDEDPLRVTFQVSLNDLFTMGALAINWVDKAMCEEMHQNLALFGPENEDAPSFQEGKPALGEKLLALDQEIILALKNRSFAFARIQKKRVIANRETHKIHVALDIATGPMIRFGDIHVEGLDKVSKEFVLSRATFHPNDPYSLTAIKETEAMLQKTGLFQSVLLEESEEPLKDLLPITIHVYESKPRTVGAGLSYTTTLGPGISLEWEHRNFRGSGEKLSAKIDYWKKERIATLSYTLPRFLQNEDKNLLLILQHDDQTYLPFHSSALKASSLIDHQVTKRFDAIYGVSLERLESSKIVESKVFHLAKVPLQLKWSTANSLLDPTEGTSIHLRSTPSYQFLAPCFSYFINTLSMSNYFSPENNRCTLATRFTFGTILGEPRHLIPIPDRFFAGSDTSLRGYKTGSVSPLNDYNEPIGGRSLLLGSFEFRLRTTSDLGWVLFYDIGNVYTNILPDLYVPFLSSVGLGARYATPIGPIRLDIAFPLKRRHGIDPAFQIYFSIGQAF